MHRRIYHLILYALLYGQISFELFLISMQTNKSFEELFNFVENAPSVMSAANLFTDEDWSLGWQDNPEGYDIKSEFDMLTELHKRL
ncbi:hypothetical protein NEAUS04_0943 [Nematocida ausubeli]|uniref:Uncharacterized protein n=1 Tax=Nematocida ausubeli (strain ATCC PRA-371 / ERTm2) TaxID=1913371 RepID=H8ZFP4_NEMA1|nr:uncharacterized protein NESG_00463 [Nematocida ausubeli]EHY64605.1 hypothetical protein NERG_02415 [Nematocida ausubeli]KAI5136146.1 hypothetical protein NEAUS06_1770 [Nematocida ausubeli]KAI5148535.1 hypothetical protein NEAUS05_1417 [Nematocida ausubeli]KAI5162215.1 hypothetical protein NEAUS04_0943 [Nematocida ausubeli]KFG27385.1 hypothetical protein NESG_00463 [Nematocida ausubeli]